MNLEDVHYDAFISYRHLDKDMMVAKLIHKQLEAFRLPSSVKKTHPGMKTRISRVFRDQEELPLTSNLGDPIQIALQNSDFLIVICTPKLRESLWCQKEIETFIQLHGRDKVFAVLAEGEPSESFPEQLLVDENGNPIEPLGADVRGNTEAEIKKKLKVEILRLIAPMLGLNFDDLKQRHREQKMKRLMLVGAAAMAFMLGFGIYMAITAITIRSQADEIAKQNATLIENERKISEQNAEILAKSYETCGKIQEIKISQAHSLLISGKTEEALQTMREVMPATTQDTQIPYNPDAQRELTRISDYYDCGDSFFPVHVFDNCVDMISMRLSPDGSMLAIVNEDFVIHIYSLESYEELVTLKASADMYFYEPDFIDNQQYLYQGDNGMMCYSFETGKSEPIAEENGSVVASRSHLLYTIQDITPMTIYDTATHRRISQLEDCSDDWSVYVVCSRFTADDRYLVQVVMDLDEGGFVGGDLLIRTFETASGRLLYENRIEGDYTLAELNTSSDAIYISMMLFGKDCVYSYYLRKYDLTGGQLLWDKWISNYSLKELEECELDGKKVLFAFDYNSVYTIDAETGEILADGGGYRLLEAFRGGERGYLLATDTGNVVAAVVGRGALYDYQYMMYPPQKAPDKVLFGNGIFYYFKDENCVVRYCMTVNSSARALEEIPEEMLSIFGVDEHGFTTESQELQLENGYYLVREGASSIYILNENRDIVADINSCIGYNPQTNELIMENRFSQLYAIPVLNYEELIAFVDNQLQSRNGESSDADGDYDSGEEGALGSSDTSGTSDASDASDAEEGAAKEQLTMEEIVEANSKLELVQGTTNEDLGISTLPMEMYLKVTGYHDGILLVDVINESGATMFYGRSYFLDRMNEATGEWEELPMVEAMMWAQDMIEIADLETQSTECDLNPYGALEPGSYRIRKADMSCEFALK